MSANPYETGEQKNIPAVLLYVFTRFAGENADRVLMIHRDAKDRPGDFHAGKWNGLGGKCEKDESYRETASRELFEESTLRVAPEAFRFAGFLQFPNFKPKKAEDWSCMLFSADVPEAVARSVPKAVGEGSLHWIETGKIRELNLWDGDREFLPLVLARRPFTGAGWYRDGAYVRGEITPL
ncbi:MAG: NUDIX domain-containing protein [Bdellovibrionales bacterium]|nr:NUDIX domain-containing protein [Bdellovibrionales bacterium]